MAKFSTCFIEDVPVDFIEHLSADAARGLEKVLSVIVNNYIEVGKKQELCWIVNHSSEPGYELNGARVYLRSVH
jgi:hypothetical protein